MGPTRPRCIPREATATREGLPPVLPSQLREAALWYTVPRRHPLEWPRHSGGHSLVPSPTWERAHGPPVLVHALHGVPWVHPWGAHPSAPQQVDVVGHLLVGAGGPLEVLGVCHQVLAALWNARRGLSEARGCRGGASILHLPEPRPSGSGYGVPWGACLGGGEGWGVPRVQWSFRRRPLLGRAQPWQGAVARKRSQGIRGEPLCGVGGCSLAVAPETHCAELRLWNVWLHLMLLLILLLMVRRVLLLIMLLLVLLVQILLLVLEGARMQVLGIWLVVCQVGELSWLVLMLMLLLLLWVLEVRHSLGFQEGHRMQRMPPRASPGGPGLAG